MELFPMDLHVHHEQFDKEGGMPLNAVSNIITQVCAGLSALHSCGYVHTDIKLENILIRPLSNNTSSATSAKKQHKKASKVSKAPQVVQAVICDLGSAHKMDGPLIPEGHTLQFSSPEILTEEAGSIRPHTDVFSLGCVLYVLLTGADLFDIRDDEHDYLDMMALQQRYSTHPHHLKIQQHKEFFHRNGMLHNNATLRWAQLPLWYEVYQQYLPENLIQLIRDLSLIHI